jgi:hypothetical protein
VHILGAVHLRMKRGVHIGAHLRYVRIGVGVGELVLVRGALGEAGGRSQARSEDEIVIG